eukprot:2137245-Alexandrium_andersonii.AAC.1
MALNLHTSRPHKRLWRAPEACVGGFRGGCSHTPRIGAQETARACEHLAGNCREIARELPGTISCYLPQRST